MQRRRCKSQSFSCLLNTIFTRKRKEQILFTQESNLITRFAEDRFVGGWGNVCCEFCVVCGSSARASSSVFVYEWESVSRHPLLHPFSSSSLVISASSPVNHELPAMRLGRRCSSSPRNYMITSNVHVPRKFPAQGKRRPLWRKKHRVSLIVAPYEWEEMHKRCSCRSLRHQVCCGCKEFLQP